MTLRSFTVAFSLALAFAGLPACGSGSSGNERWVTTKNTNADIVQTGGQTGLTLQFGW